MQDHQINLTLVNDVGNPLSNGAKQITSIGQLVANDMKKTSGNKKRRSKEHQVANDEDPAIPKNSQNKVCNKENIIETERLNRSANKKRLERLMNRAKERSGSLPDNKYSRKGERKSIKVTISIYGKQGLQENID